jgi:hypothetical protein
MEAGGRDPAGNRRPVLERTEFSSDPRALRDNLAKLNEHVDDAHSEVRRRLDLTFGELVARWQAHFAGEPMAVSLEVLDNAVRLVTGGARRVLDKPDWDELVTPVVADLVDDWGPDRRHEGDAWFEFREPRPRRG